MNEPTHQDMLGHELFGVGPRAVIVLNDWLCDTSTWDGARSYLDGEAFRWVFADLRGYGRSRGLPGEFTLKEAAADVLRLADALGLERFSVVGHSMSCLVALHLAQHYADRIERAVALTPPPPAGFGVDDATVSAMQALAKAGEADSMAGLRTLLGDRLSERWIAFKAARWRAVALPEAAAAYVVMFAQQGLPDPKRRIAPPVLAVTGEEDAPYLRRDAVMEGLRPLCDQLVVTPILECGHYPMQEAPPRTVTIVERFLAAQTPIGG